MRETVLAARVRSWLLEQGWDVHQEVAVDGTGRRADLVAYRTPLLWVIETKMAFGVEVLGQAHRWRPYAHHVAVAVPLGRDTPGREYGLRSAMRDGIGVLRVLTTVVQEVVSPRMLRRPPAVQRLLDRLCDETRSAAAAGSRTGGFHSPWRATCQLVRRIVASQPGCTTKELMAEIGDHHHYASSATARSALVKWARAKQIAGIRVEEGSPLRWYPEAMPVGDVDAVGMPHARS